MWAAWRWANTRTSRAWTGISRRTPRCCTRYCGWSRMAWAMTAPSSWTVSKATWACAETLVDLAALAAGTVGPGPQEGHGEAAYPVEQLELDAPAAVVVQVEDVEPVGHEPRH